MSSGTLFIKQTYKRTKISWTPDGAKKLLLREVKICKPCVPRAGSSESNKTKYFRHRLYDTVWFLPECSDYSLNACLMFSEGSESSWSHPDRWTDKQTDTLFPWAPVRAKKCSRIWLWILIIVMNIPTSVRMTPCPLRLQLQTSGIMLILTRKCQFVETSAW